MADLVDRTGCEVYIHIMDKPKLTDDAGMLANLFRIRGHRNYTGKVNVFTEDDILKLDELEFDVLETPGHTSGSVCFICVREIPYFQEVLAELICLMEAAQPL